MTANYRQETIVNYFASLREIVSLVWELSGWLRRTALTSAKDSLMMIRVENWSLVVSKIQSIFAWFIMIRQYSIWHSPACCRTCWLGPRCHSPSRWRPGRSLTARRRTSAGSWTGTDRTGTAGGHTETGRFSDLLHLLYLLHLLHLLHHLHLHH